MGKIIITGATGQLGSVVVQRLLERGTEAGQLVVVVRDPGKAASWQRLGIEVRRGDYDQPDSLVPAFVGADKLLFISSPSLDNTLRVRQHASVVEAARNAKVGRLLYTGLAFAEEMRMSLENVHLATEYMIRTTGIPFTFLRNGFYLDLLVNESLRSVTESGVLYSTTGSGKVNYVERDDLALAAAVALTREGEGNQSYNLVNPQPFTYGEFARTLAEVSGRPVRHVSLSADEMLARMVADGVSAPLAGFLVHVVFAAVSAGQFSRTSTDLTDLIGDKVTPLQTSIKRVLLDH